MQINVKQTINSIENLLQNKTLYFSSDENVYFMGFHGGMGNFELFQLPKECTGLFVRHEIETELLTSIVTGTLRIDGQTTDDVNCHTVQIQKVICAELSLKGDCDENRKR